MLPRDYARVIAAREQAESDGLDDETLTDRMMEALQWLTPRGFMTTPRKVAERRPVAERIHDWQEVYPGTPGRAVLPIISEQAGRCMDCGIPFCHIGCPLGNLIPEWNDLVWRPRLGRGVGAAARDQQLPGVHRAALPGAVRDRLRGRDQPGPGDDQERRGRHHRQGVGRAPGHAAAAGVAHRQDGGRGRFRARPGWPWPSS